MPIPPPPRKQALGRAGRGEELGDLLGEILRLLRENLGRFQHFQGRRPGILGRLGHILDVAGDFRCAGGRLLRRGRDILGRFTLLLDRRIDCVGDFVDLADE